MAFWRKKKFRKWERSILPIEFGWKVRVILFIDRWFFSVETNTSIILFFLLLFCSSLFFSFIFSIFWQVSCWKIRFYFLFYSYQINTPAVTQGLKDICWTSYSINWQRNSNTICNIKKNTCTTLYTRYNAYRPSLHLKLWIKIEHLIDMGMLFYPSNGFKYYKISITIEMDCTYTFFIPVQQTMQFLWEKKCIPRFFPIDLNMVGYDFFLFSR